MAKPKLRMPSDPEGQNGERAEWARVGIEAFMKETGLHKLDGREMAIYDFLADLGHLLDREGLSLFGLMRHAARHYRDETLGPKPGNQFNFMGVNIDG